MGKETELKLKLPPDQVDRFRRHPIIQQLKLERARARHLVSTYYDTRDMALRGESLSLRLRKTDSRIIQTLKSLAPAASGIHERNEWEQIVTGSEPEISALPVKKIKKRLKSDRKRNGLAAVFTTDMKRTAWQLRCGDDHIELALDLGEIRTPDGKTEPVCEVEMELKEGDKKSLLDLALAFNERIDFTLEERTKSDRGYALICKEHPTPQHADPVKLRNDMTAFDAFISIAQNCWMHFRANVPAVRSGVDPEGIHQARVAVRRLRAAIKAFRPILPRPEQQKFSGELKWLQNALGVARDWDVFINETLVPISAQFPNDRRLPTLIRSAEDRRQIAYCHAREALESRRYGHLDLAFHFWLLELETAQSETARRPVQRFAASAIDRATKRLKKAGSNINHLDDTELHELRILGKRARYCVEFFATLFAAKPVKRHLRALKQLQDCLGQLNDSAVASEFVQTIDEKKHLRHHRVTGLVGGWHAAQVSASKVNLAPIWANLIGTRKYWADS